MFLPHALPIAMSRVRHLRPTPDMPETGVPIAQDEAGTVLPDESWAYVWVLGHYTATENVEITITAPPTLPGSSVEVMVDNWVLYQINRALTDSGIDTIGFRITDIGGSAEATITITVRSSSEEPGIPIAQDETAIVITGMIFVVVPVLGHYTPTENVEVTIIANPTLPGSSAHVTPEREILYQVDREITDSGLDTIGFRIDDTGGFDEATINITVLSSDVLYVADHLGNHYRDHLGNVLVSTSEEGPPGEPETIAILNPQRTGGRRGDTATSQVGSATFSETLSYTPADTAGQRRSLLVTIIADLSATATEANFTVTVGGATATRVAFNTLVNGSRHEAVAVFVIDEPIPAWSGALTVVGSIARSGTVQAADRMVVMVRTLSGWEGAARVVSLQQPPGQINVPDGTNHTTTVTPDTPDSLIYAAIAGDLWGVNGTVSLPAGAGLQSILVYDTFNAYAWDIATAGAVAGIPITIGINPEDLGSIADVCMVAFALRPYVPS